VSVRDTPLSYGPFHDAVNWLSERDIGRDQAVPGRHRVSGTAVSAKLEPPSPTEGAGRENAESKAVPNGDARRGTEEGSEIECQQNEAAAARPRHDQANGRTRGLEPDAEWLQHPTERNQAGEREG